MLINCKPNKLAIKVVELGNPRDEIDSHFHNLHTGELLVIIGSVSYAGSGKIYRTGQRSSKSSCSSTESKDTNAHYATSDQMEDDSSLHVVKSQI